MFFYSLSHTPTYHFPDSTLQLRSHRFRCEIMRKRNGQIANSEKQRWDTCSLMWQRRPFSLLPLEQANFILIIYLYFIEETLGGATAPNHDDVFPIEVPQRVHLNQSVDLTCSLCRGVREQKGVGHHCVRKEGTLVTVYRQHTQTNTTGVCVYQTTLLGRGHCETPGGWRTGSWYRISRLAYSHLLQVWRILQDFMSQ